MLGKHSIFLIGPMGSGKTAVAKCLARLLDYPFYDSDHEIERRSGADVPLIFEREGEAGFRRREREVIAELTARPRIVLATGGGAILDPDNRRELASRGATYQPAQDVSSWVQLNLGAYHQQAQVVRHRIERSGRTWRLLMDYAEQAGLDERVVSALHDVAMTGRARRLRYEHAEGLSLQQAQRDLRALLQRRHPLP